MIFNYHPILGLQYYTFENEVFYLEPLVCEKTSEELLREWRDTVSELGIDLIESAPKTEENWLPIYSNF